MDKSRRAPALTHLDERGQAHMVDVGEKATTLREAVAMARLRMSAEAFRALTAGALPKGDAVAVARLAGIQAAKRTADWIPLCHPLPLDAVAVDIEPDPTTRQVTIRAVARAHARTGVEMEALVAASAAALALYDMVKAVDRALVIEEVRLVQKTGGRRGPFVHPRSTDLDGTHGGTGTHGRPGTHGNHETHGGTDHDGKRSE